MPSLGGALTVQPHLLYLKGNESLRESAFDVFCLSDSKESSGLMSDTYTLYNQTVMDHFMNPR
ncbi:MAG: hypothetical protein JWM68_461, partial [Verrucomicrobiales bacterium]|nr:hypothetical protein [Verrucomicrobiales bacterium]